MRLEILKFDFIFVFIYIIAIYVDTEALFYVSKLKKIEREKVSSLNGHNTCPDLLNS